MITVKSDFGFCDIYIAGCGISARQFLREFCLDGMCVSVIDVDYIYTLGAESGVKVSLINYARFPCSQEVLTNKGKHIAEFLIEKLHQGSASVVSPSGSFFISRRSDFA